MNENGRKRIIISSGRHLIPVAKMLGNGCEFVTLRPDFAQALGNLDLPAAPLAGLTTAEMRTNGFNFAANVIKRTKAPAKRDGWPEAMADWLRRDLGGWLFPRLGDLCMLPLALGAAGIDLAIVHNDVEPLTRCVALWARQAGVPCLHVPHAIYMDWEKGPPGSDIHDLITASHLAAAGPFQRAWYEARGFPSHMIRETGLPQFDAWAGGSTEKDRERSRKLMRLDGRDPVVFYADSWGQRTNLLGCHDGVDRTCEAFLEATKRFDGVDWILSTHPHARNLDQRVRLAREAGADVIMTDRHLRVCLSVADLALAFAASNIVIEAAHCVHLRLASTGGYQDDPEVAKVKPTVDGIAEGIEAVLAKPPPDTRRFLAKYVGVPDGKAAQRIAEFARELLCE